MATEIPLHKETKLREEISSFATQYNPVPLKDPHGQINHNLCLDRAVKNRPLFHTKRLDRFKRHTGQG